ncbi:unnamed protein product [marine sediment metagenome]|uniref:Type II toxin-antitoxin system RelE/ParE family toxin n=1 Tax=marine sediment metagenome TaxID=412755 RepID=X1KFQ2_9ZZZZ
MPYRLRITETARREFRRLPAHTRERVRHTIEAMADDPRPHGCKKLRAVDAYRVRVGDYRVIYDVDDALQIIMVLRIKHRREAYRDL